MHFRHAPLLLPSLALLLAAPAAAQDLAGAEALFKRGIADMEDGHFATACPALAESQRLDPRPGTLFALAECESKAGKIATAVARYEDYLRSVSTLGVAQRNKHRDRAQRAAAERDTLAAQIPELSLVLPAGAPAGVRVTRDGVELAAPSLGVAMPVDPGEHVVVVQPPSGPSIEERITLERGAKKTLELKLKPPESKPVAKMQLSGAEGSPEAAAHDRTSTPEGAATARGKGRRLGGYIAGGVGVAGLALGGVTGLLTLGRKSTIEQGCVDIHCTHEGKIAADSAKTMGLISTVGFGVGAAGIAVGITLLLTAPPAPKTGRATPWVSADVLAAGPNGAVMGVKGAF